MLFTVDMAMGYWIPFTDSSLYESLIKVNRIALFTYIILYWERLPVNGAEQRTAQVRERLCESSCEQ